MQEKGADKRKFSRFTLDVKVRCLDFIASHKNEVQSKNISQGGVCIITGSPLIIGRHVNLVFYLPDKIDIKAVAQVRWSKRAGTDNYENGLGFTDITKENREMIKEFITNDEKKQSTFQEHRKEKRVVLGVVFNFMSVEAEINNINEKGICIESVQLFQKGKIADIIFFLPSSTKVKATGKIIWRRATTANKYEYGLEFVDIDNKSIENIKKYITGFSL